MAKYVIEYRTSEQGDFIAYGITDTLAKSTTRQGEEWANYYYSNPEKYEAGLTRLKALVEAMNATYEELQSLKTKTEGN